MSESHAVSVCAVWKRVDYSCRNNDVYEESIKILLNWKRDKQADTARYHGKNICIYRFGGEQNEEEGILSALPHRTIPHYIIAEAIVCARNTWYIPVANYLQSQKSAICFSSFMSFWKKETIVDIKL